MLIADNFGTRMNFIFFILGVLFSWAGELPFLQTVIKVDGKFALTMLNIPNIIVPVFSEQPQQHCFNGTILAGSMKHSYLRTAIGGNIFCVTNERFIEFCISIFPLIFRVLDLLNFVTSRALNSSYAEEN
jgi:hypothetical protein